VSEEKKLMSASKRASGRSLIPARGMGVRNDRDPDEAGGRRSLKKKRGAPNDGTSLGPSAMKKRPCDAQPGEAECDEDRLKGRRRHQPPQKNVPLYTQTEKGAGHIQKENTIVEPVQMWDGGRTRRITLVEKNVPIREPPKNRGGASNGHQSARMLASLSSEDQ